jgi:excisionase family DNA binding protein
MPTDAPASEEVLPEVMTVAEAARYLRLAEQVLYRHVRAGTVPASRVGKTIRFKKSVLDAWLEESAWRTVGRKPHRKKTPQPASPEPPMPKREPPPHGETRRRRPPRRDFRVEFD